MAAPGPPTPCWRQRPRRPTTSSSSRRRRCPSQGYRIVADYGDQYSDLLGGSAGHEAKLPDPMYYLP
ncbi:MAG: hypothetical protein J2P26_07760 [Nocardiopsaceae bacterium]|nr:hypothetical protein [Nocardiopsaceae bacterium]